MLNQQWYEEIYFVYCQCIYALEYFKNVPYNNYVVNDEEYAYYRLYRAIEYVFTNIYNVPPTDPRLTSLINYTKIAIDNIKNNEDPLYTEESIDKSINQTILQYFQYFFNYTEKYDDFYKNDMSLNIGLDLNSAYLSDSCTHKKSILTDTIIEGVGIQLQQGCIGINDIIGWLKSMYPGQDINKLPNEYFLNPYTKQSLPLPVINFIRHISSPGRMTRSQSPNMGGKKKTRRKNKKNKTFEKI